MITYKASYRFIDGGVHAELLDFPGVITCADRIDEARRLLGSALLDMAGSLIDDGEALPIPDPMKTEAESDLEEPMHLHLQASTAIEIVPRGMVIA